jgi:hypothetical protein
MYRALEPGKIVDTIDLLEARISARFPGASLTRVCAELGQIARENRPRADRLQRPNWQLRLSIAAAIAAGLSLLAWVAVKVIRTETQADFYGQLQGIEALFNIVVLTGGAILFMTTMEGRAKRAMALADLHELRSIVHVIDMHQLTKDPSLLIAGASRTAASPARTLTPFELTRYLDYCSEMLSLTAKVAALYAQFSSDPVIIEAVNDLERLTTNLSQKIWQKITLVQSMSARATSAAIEAPSSPPIADPGGIGLPAASAPARTPGT